MSRLVGATGFEPASDSAATNGGISLYENTLRPGAAIALHRDDLSFPQSSLNDSVASELPLAVQRLARLWPFLPVHVRETLLIVAEAAVRTSGEKGDDV